MLTGKSDFRRPDHTVAEIEYATFCVVAVSVVTACGGGVPHDAAPPGDSASECSAAVVEELRAAARSDYGDVDEVLCFGDWAKVVVDTRAVTDANPPSIFLFHHDDGDWRVVQYGSGFDCTDEGVPPSTATKLEC